MKNPDIIVIGGGIIGLSCAWRLKQAGLNVVLVERSTVGSGSSGASLGAVWPPSPAGRGTFRKIHRKSLAMFEGFTAEILERSGIDPGCVRCGGIELIVTSAQLGIAEKEVKASREHPNSIEGMEIISPCKCRELIPGIAPAPYGALYCHDTQKVEVEKLIQGLYRVCKNEGVLILEGENAVSVKISNSRVIGVKLERSEMKAPNVLAATGAWTSSLSPLLTRWCPVKPVKGQALQIKTKNLLLPQIVKLKPAYLLQNDSDSIIVGSTAEPEAGFDAKPTEPGKDRLLKGAAKIMPKLESAFVLKHWAGLRPLSGDRKPFIGAVPEAEGLYAACGHYKIGIGLAPITAEAITNLIVNRTVDGEVNQFAPREINWGNKRTTLTI